MCKKTSSKTHLLKKGRLPTFSCPQNWQTSSFLCIFDTIYCSFDTKGTFASFCLTFSQKLANVHPGQNVGKRTPPPNLGGSVGELWFVVPPGAPLLGLIFDWRCDRKTSKPFSPTNIEFDAKGVSKWNQFLLIDWDDLYCPRWTRGYR